MRKENEVTRVLRLGMMVALPIGLASCAPEERDVWEEEPATEVPEMEAFEPLNVDIEGVDTNVSGEATLSRVGESIMVSLTADNLPGDGPFQAQILAGRCDGIEDVRGQLDLPRDPATEPGEPGTEPRTLDQTLSEGEVLATLQPIQITGAQGMSHSNVSVSDLQGHLEAAITIEGPGNEIIACADIANLEQVTLGTGAGTAPMTPGQPGQPGQPDEPRGY